VEKWLEIDRYAIVLATELQRNVLEDYKRYEFHPAVTRLLAFCFRGSSARSIWISSRTGCIPVARILPRARSAQNVLYHITAGPPALDGADSELHRREAWKFAGKGSESVFLHTWYELPRADDGDALLERWNLVREARMQVQKNSKPTTGGKIGSVSAGGDRSSWHLERSTGRWQRSATTYAFVMITSNASLALVSSGDEEVIAVPSPHPKCERCWHYRADVDSDPAHPGICGRCVQNLYRSGEPRRFA